MHERMGMTESVAMSVAMKEWVGMTERVGKT